MSPPRSVGWNCDAGARQDVLAGQQVLQVAVTAERDHVRMLEQQQMVRHAPRLRCATSSLLQVERAAVVHAAEIAHVDNYALMARP